MMNSQNICLSVVIPVLNEIDNVLPLYDEIKAALDGQITFEVIFVDDGSVDGTVQTLNELTAAESNVKLVQHKVNFGQSAAFVSGVRASQYDWIVTMDGDRQNDPKDILTLVEHLSMDKKQVILGNRQKRDDSLLKKLTSRIGNGIRQRVLKDECPDTGCSLKLFPEAAFMALPHFNHLHRFLPALFKRQGYEVVNVPVNHRARVAGTSKYGLMNRLFVGMYDLIGVVWLMKRPCNPEVMGE